MSLAVGIAYLHAIGGAARRQGIRLDDGLLDREDALDDVIPHLFLRVPCNVVEAFLHVLRVRHGHKSILHRAVHDILRLIFIIGVPCERSESHVEELFGLHLKFMFFLHLVSPLYVKDIN